MPVCRTRKEAAEVLGITAEALRLWTKEAWFPGDATERDPRNRRFNWDTDKIAAARDAQGRKGSDLDELDREIQRATRQAKLRKLESEARERERKEAEAAGNILPRDEYEAFLAECIVVARDRLLALPKTLARLVTGPTRKKVQTEGERIVRRVLEGLAEAIEKKPT